MNIDQDLILRLETLARIELTPEERERTGRDLQKILDYMDILSRVDTERDQSEGFPGERVNVFREDESVPSPGPDALLEDAPDAKDGQFRAPKTFE